MCTGKLEFRGINPAHLSTVADKSLAGGTEIAGLLALQRDRATLSVRRHHTASTLDRTRYAQRG